jgi:thioredoxin reductase (NADPH)
MVESTEYDFDFFVIGGGSGGLAASKEAADLGKKVGLADYVVPTPFGTKWGLGGTCVNVGCIPKKMMHHSGLMYEQLELYEKYGYPKKIEREHLWGNLVQNIQTYIKKLNFGYKAALRTKKVTYFNSYAKFIEKNKISLTNAKGEEQIVTAKNILVATGGRPNYNEIEGSKECCITSDDLFSLKKSPGKTLVVGASYIALECGGFLASLGYDTSIMVRSILLRGFDQDMAQRIGDYMEKRNTKFIHKANPTRFSKADDGQINVEYTQDGIAKVDKYDTVLLAIGRYVDSKAIYADKVGLSIAKNGKLIVNEAEETNIPGIYSIGDCAEGRPELTPPAIMAGKLLAKRLFGGSHKLMNYRNVATTVFTPLEYGAVGYIEEDAFKSFGEDSIKVYHSEFTPLEWQFDLLRGETGYLKIIVNTKDSNRIIGIHILAPNAGEIVQGFSAAINAGITKDQLDNTVGIHPTVAEELTTCLSEKGVDSGKKDGC